MDKATIDRMQQDIERGEAALRDAFNQGQITEWEYSRAHYDLGSRVAKGELDRVIVVRRNPMWKAVYTLTWLTMIVVPILLCAALIYVALRLT